MPLALLPVVLLATNLAEMLRLHRLLRTVWRHLTTLQNRLETGDEPVVHRLVSLLPDLPNCHVCSALLGLDTGFAE